MPACISEILPHANGRSINLSVAKFSKLCRNDLILHLCSFAESDGRQYIDGHLCVLTALKIS